MWRVLCWQLLVYGGVAQAATITWASSVTAMNTDRVAANAYAC